MHVIKKENNRKLIQKLYQDSKNELYYAAFDVLEDKDAAERVVYHCFSKLLEMSHLYSRMSYESLQKLAYIITRYLAFSKSNVIKRLPVSGSIAVLENFSAQEICLLTLHYVYGLTPSEIGTLTGTSSALIRSRIHKCRSRFIASSDQVQ